MHHVIKLLAWIFVARAQVERMCGFALRNAVDAELALATTELSRHADAMRAVNRLV